MATTSTSNSNTLLVTGASGQLGRQVITLLLDTHHVAPSRIVAGTRDPQKLADLAARGVNVRRIDFDDQALLPSALAGADRMLLISTDAFDRPGHRITQHTAAVDAARTAGITHIVYTSMIDPENSLVTAIARDHLATERAIEASGLGYTILRNAWYMDLYTASLPGVLASGTWYTSAGDGRTSPISREDCARIAAAALVSTDRSSARYDVTGPELLTTEQVAAVATGVFGKPIRVINVTDEQLAQGMRAHGVPDQMVPFWVSFDTNTRAGKVNVLSDAVQKLTGRAPQTLADFFKTHESAFVPATV